MFRASAVSRVVHPSMEICQKTSHDWGMDLLADGGLNLFRQVQQEQLSRCRFVASSSNGSEAKRRAFDINARRIIERSDDQVPPDSARGSHRRRANGSSFGAILGTCGSGRSETCASCSASFHPEELRDLRREVVIEAVFPAPALNVEARIERRTPARRHGHASRRSVSEASGWFCVVSSEFIVEFSRFECRTATSLSATTEFWQKRVYGLRSTGSGR